MKELDQQAYDLGWDYATFEMPVPENARKAFCDGYRSFKLGNTKTTKKPDRFVRKWLQVRHGAQLRNKHFSPDITHDYIDKITPLSGRCPVIDKKLTYGEREPTDWSIDRANNDRGYVRGNLIIMSQFANSAKSNQSLE